MANIDNSPPRSGPSSDKNTTWQMFGAAQLKILLMSCQIVNITYYWPAIVDCEYEYAPASLMPFLQPSLHFNLPLSC